MEAKIDPTAYLPPLAQRRFAALENACVHASKLASVYGDRPDLKEQAMHTEKTLLNARRFVAHTRNTGKKLYDEPLKAEVGEGDSITSKKGELKVLREKLRQLGMKSNRGDTQYDAIRKALLAVDRECAKHFDAAIRDWCAATYDQVSPDVLAEISDAQAQLAVVERQLEALVRREEEAGNVAWRDPWSPPEIALDVRVV